MAAIFYFLKKTHKTDCDICLQNSDKRKFFLQFYEVGKKQKKVFGFFAPFYIFSR